VKPPEFQVRYEDDHLAVVAKAPGVIVHRGAATKSATLVDSLSKQMTLAPMGGPDRPGIVHRLDKDTSGLLIIAKTDDALAGLLESMKSRQISRSYLAMVAGAFRMPSGRIEAPIQRSSKDPTKMVVTGGGKAGITHFWVLEDLSEVSYLKIKLQTGRTHQIRVHMAHIKHPVIGDPAYGRATLDLAGRIGLPRIFLHSASLVFPHPAGEGMVSVDEPLPDDLQEPLDKARSGVRQPI